MSVELALAHYARATDVVPKICQEYARFSQDPLTFANPHTNKMPVLYLRAHRHINVRLNFSMYRISSMLRPYIIRECNEYISIITKCIFLKHSNYILRPFIIK